MRRIELAVGLALLAALVGLFAWRPELVERLEYQLHDWRFRLRGPEPARGPVAIVAIDAKSVDELGRWPWRRSVIARLVDRLSDAGATAVGFDVVFSEPETPPELGALRTVVEHLEREGGGEGRVARVLDGAVARADTDAALEAALRRSDRVVGGYFFRTAEEVAVEGEGRADRPLDEALPLIRKSRMVARTPPGMQPAPLLRCTSVETNLPRFTDAFRRLGFFNARPDPDGVVRRTSLVARCGSDFYKALSLAVYELAVGQKSNLVWDAQGFVRAARVADREIPLDEGARVLVNYRGPPRTFPHHSAVDVILGRVPDRELEGRMVLVGATETGIKDLYASPFTSVAPGVEVHANVLDNLWAGDVLRRHDSLLALEAGLVVGLALLTMLAVPRLGTALRGAAFAALLLALLVAGTVWAFLAHGLLVNLAYPALSVVAMYVGMTVVHGAAEERQARFIRNTFQQFVPPEVVEEMIARPQDFVMGGQRRDLSLLFSDIRNFTGLSEELGPGATTSLLNGYLTPMTRIVFDSRGTLDKYIGDAIVAFWNAPLPVPEHPLRAAEAALAMQEAVQTLRERAELRGADRLRIGIGIHAAEVQVGKMGSDLRFDYTVTGDGVNLCSRLEGMTKQYGAGIITSGELVERLPTGFLLRELDAIRVKGRREPVRIFELLGRRGPERGDKDWLDAWAAGLAAYRRGDWTEARRAFDAARAARGGDPACDLLAERVDALEQRPPPTWDGIWTFETK